MILRALILGGYFALALILGLQEGDRKSDGLAAEAPLIAVMIAEMHAERRIAITVVNVGTNNIELIESPDHAENMGDAEVVFERGGREFRRGRRASQLIADVVRWHPKGTGFTRARGKSEYVAALGLDVGCYRMRVTYSNAAAQKARTSGQPGPVTTPARDIAQVCFDEADVARGLQLRESAKLS